jgi:hypothetical protein
VATVRERPVVPYTSEFQRIVNLPFYDWEKDARMPALAEALTQRLKTPNGQQSLWLPQAKILMDLHDLGGAIGALKMGEGKSHVAFTAPMLLGAQRPVLFVPGKLDDDTKYKFDALAEHWQRHPNLVIKTYEWLSNKKNAKWLEEYEPDLVEGDEAGAWKNRAAACTARLERYLAGQKKFRVRLLFLTATLFDDRSVLEYHHLLRWALGPAMMPLPASSEEASYWGKAFDVKVKDEDRVELGALSQLGSTVDEVRTNIGRMLRISPGITMTSKPGVEASLYLTTWSDIKIRPRSLRSCSKPGKANAPTDERSKAPTSSSCRKSWQRVLVRLGSDAAGRVVRHAQVLEEARADGDRVSRRHRHRSAGEGRDPSRAHRRTRDS